jgi:hypothetical protein
MSCEVSFHKWYDHEYRRLINVVQVKSIDKRYFLWVSTRPLDDSRWETFGQTASSFPADAALRGGDFLCPKGLRLPGTTPCRKNKQCPFGTLPEVAELVRVWPPALPAWVLSGFPKNQIRRTAWHNVFRHGPGWPTHRNLARRVFVAVSKKLSAGRLTIISAARPDFGDLLRTIRELECYAGSDRRRISSGTAQSNAE